MLPPSLQHTIRGFESRRLTSDFVVRSQRFLRARARPRPVPVKTHDGIFFPRHTDKLFWCLFIFQNGIDEYEAIGQNAFSVETSTKIAMVEEIRRRKDHLAANRKKCMIASAEADLVGSAFIALDTFQVACMAYDVRVLIIHEKRAMRVGSGDGPVWVVRRCDGRYGFETEPLQDGSLPSGVIEVSDLERPLKSLSSYRRDDLVGIATRIGVETVSAGKPKLKGALYQEILETL